MIHEVGFSKIQNEWGEGEICNFIPSWRVRTISTRDHRPRSSYKFEPEFAFFTRLMIVGVSLVHRREWKAQQRDRICYLTSIYSCNVSGGLGILGARLFSALQAQTICTIFACMLCISGITSSLHFIILTVTKHFDFDLIHEWTAAAME